MDDTPSSLRISLCLSSPLAQDHQDPLSGKTHYPVYVAPTRASRAAVSLHPGSSCTEPAKPAGSKLQMSALVSIPAHVMRGVLEAVTLLCASLTEQGTTVFLGMGKSIGLEIRA